eukprot:2339226-Amphidinium_carterae.1
MLRCLSVCMLSYYDDFGMLEFDAVLESAWKSAELLLKLLGWAYADADHKRLPFATEFGYLGVVFDL